MCSNSIDFAQSFVNETTTSGMLKAKELSIVMLSLINRAPEISLSYVQSIYEYYFSCHAVFFESIEKCWILYIQVTLVPIAQDCLIIHLFI